MHKEVVEKKILNEITKLKKSHAQEKYYERKIYKWVQQLEVTLNDAKRTSIIVKWVFDERNLIARERNLWKLYECKATAVA